MSLIVFNQYLLATFREAIAQQINLFNAASNGGIILKAAANVGDFNDVASWQRIAGLVRRRNAYGSGDVTAIDLSQIMATSVKVAAGTPPINLPTSLLAWIGRDPGEAGVKVGLQLAEDALADMLNTGLLVFVSAVGNIAANTYDGTAANLSLGVLNTGASKYGDRASDLLCWVSHSKPVFDLYGAALTNANNLFTFGSVRVVSDGFGRPIIITDSPSLTYTSSGTKYRTVGLTAGGIVIEQNPDFNSKVVPVLGKENINEVMQAEWSMQLALKGFAWDKTNGGASPNDSALATATNWDRYATSNKDLAGVLIKSL